LQQGLSLKEKEYWESGRNFVKCTVQQIKQPEAGCSVLKTRFATSSKNRAGYEPIKPEDVPGWEYATLKTGDWAGFIGVNEMLAFKLPMDLYGKYKMLVNSNVSRRDI